MRKKYKLNCVTNWPNRLCSEANGNKDDENLNKISCEMASTNAIAATNNGYNNNDGSDFISSKSNSNLSVALTPSKSSSPTSAFQPFNNKNKYYRCSYQSTSDHPLSKYKSSSYESSLFQGNISNYNNSNNQSVLEYLLSIKRTKSPLVAQSQTDIYSGLSNIVKTQYTKTNNINNNKCIRNEDYEERRRRNNEAAKRCRLNRRRMFENRLRRTTVLEYENHHLRDQLMVLNAELRRLKQLFN